MNRLQPTVTGLALAAMSSGSIQTGTRWMDQEFPPYIFTFALTVHQPAAKVNPSRGINPQQVFFSNSYPSVSPFSNEL
jgi:hypothetical protein